MPISAKLKETQNLSANIFFIHFKNQKFKMFYFYTKYSYIIKNCKHREFFFYSTPNINAKKIDFNI